MHENKDDLANVRFLGSISLLECENSFLVQLIVRFTDSEPFLQYGDCGTELLNLRKPPRQFNVGARISIAGVQLVMKFLD